ncbi:hypothetical protein HJG60_009534 [Phyllostomus discolor]|uniref:Uncharacterized protein n=1 Tax=Phyllostomus discolor TaxID=89673 RepID=A0A833YL08_9CHIR|nr:hypothetical protein HJG60_009534 [Phyllostomus discolor]
MLEGATPSFVSSAPVITAFCNYCVPCVKGRDRSPALCTLSTHFFAQYRHRGSSKTFTKCIHCNRLSSFSWACSSTLYLWMRGSLEQRRFLLSDWGCLRAVAMSSPSDSKLHQRRLYPVGVLCRRPPNG